MTELQPYYPTNTALATTEPPMPPTDSWVQVVASVSKLAAQIAATDFVPKGLRDDSAGVTAAILYGREVGLPPMSSLKSINVVHGVPSLEAEAMRALILSHGHELRFEETTATRCRMAGRRRGQEQWTTAHYTMDEAKQSGDAAKNQNYRTRPVEMLIARCTTRLARMIFPDVVGGLASPEDIETGDSAPPAPPATVTVTQDKPKPAARKRATKPAPAVEVAPQPAPEPMPQDGPPLPGEDGFEDIGAPPIEDEQPAEPVRTEAQSKKLFATLRSLGIATRDEGLEMIASILGHPIESTKDLTKAQAAKVIDALESMEEPIEAEVVDE